jgi:hypothetical protein
VGDQIKHSERGGEKKNAFWVLAVRPEEKNRLQDPGVQRRIIQK